MAETEVEIRMRLDNQATKGIKEAEQEALKIGAATARESAKAAAAAERGAAVQRRAQQRMALAREKLGIRSEKTIQREIERTKRAYDILARSGTMSWREQARAAEQMKQRVTQLTNEMGKLTKAQKAMNGLKLGAAVAGGVAAAGYVLKDPMERAADYDDKLTDMANIAFTERDKLGRIRGKKELEEIVNNSVKTGGGTREANSEALNTLLAANAMSYDDMKKIMPILSKAATASNASMSDLASIANVLIQGFGVTAEELPNALNMAVEAGNQGKFELKDMAEHLPTLLASAKGSGMRGRKDFAGVLALAQASALNAGNNSEAGTNMKNLLDAMSSTTIAGTVKAKMGINLSEYLQTEREKGVNSVDAFASLMEKHVSKRADYKALQQKMESAKTDDERQTVLSQMSDIAMGSGLGEIVGNKRALMALFALVNQNDYMQKVKQGVLENDLASGGAIDKNFETKSETTRYKLNMRRETSEMAQKEAMDKLAPTVGKVADYFTELASRHSFLVGATTLATTALTAFAGVAVTAAFAMGGGKGLVSGAKGAAGAIANGAKGAAGAVTGGAGRILATRGAASIGASIASAGLGTAAAGVIGAGAAGYGVGTLANKGINAYMSRNGQERSWGTAIAESRFGKWLSGVDIDEEAIAKSMAAIKPPEPQPVEFDGRLQLALDPGIVLKSQTMHATGGNMRMDTGNMMTGAPG